MPTPQEIETVSQRIEWLQSMSYLIEDGKLASGPVSDAVAPWWDSLSREQQDTVLREDVNWTGFTEAQENSVIERVLDGQEPEFWMDGIAPHAATAEIASMFEAIANPPRFDPGQYAQPQPETEKERGR